MRIVILGSGLMGSKLGTLFARAGHQVAFSYARDPAKLQELARQAGNNTRAASPAEAARDADVILLAVHWLRVDDVLYQAGDLSRKTLINCSLPMNEANTELTIAHTSSGAEELARKLPSTHVVSAFGTVPSEVLFPVFDSRAAAHQPKPTLLYCTDHAPAGQIAATLITDLGFEPQNAGPLRIARLLEPFALLVAQLAYEMLPNPELAYRFTPFTKRR